MKSLEDFPSRGYGCCGECRRKQARVRRVRNRDYIFEYLLKNPCVDCGETDPVVLEFDHIKGGKVANVSVLAHKEYSLEVIKAEIAKCAVRCANCHRRVTSKRRGWYL